MPKPAFRPKVFVSYSHRDRELKEKFDTNLRVLRDQQIIDCWTDGEILPGDHWPDEITNALNESTLILFLVSNHFLGSSFIRQKEVPMSMARQNRGEAVIVPIILSKTPGWQKEDWSTLQTLPSEVKPIDHPDWRTVENAFAEVEEKLRELIENLPEKLAKQAAQWRAIQSGGAGTPPPPVTPPAGGTEGQPVAARPAAARASALKWGAAAAVLGAAVLAAGFYQGRQQPAPQPQPAAAQAISPELEAWLKAPEVDRTVLKVSVAKGNGLFQNGVLPLTPGTVATVAARRIHETCWEDAQGKTGSRENGLAWELMIQGIAGPVTKPLTVTTWVKAVEKDSPHERDSGIKVDLSDTLIFEAGKSQDSPPGFTHYVSTVDAVRDARSYPNISANFVSGPKGRIPEGLHFAAFDIRQEDGRIVYRGLLNLKIPPYIEALPREEWVSAVPKSRLKASLVPGSAAWPVQNEISWKVKIEGEPGEELTQASFFTYYAASDTHAALPLAWTVDPHKDARTTRAIEIKGFNRCEFAWGEGWEEKPVNILKDGSATQLLVLHGGPRGKFQGGAHDVALELRSKGEPVWRGMLTLKLPQQPWTPPEAQNKLTLTDTAGRDVSRTQLTGWRAKHFIAEGKNRPVGLSFGPLRVVNKGEALSGPFQMRCYLKATTAPQKPAGDATLSVSARVCTILATPDEGGYTAIATGALDLRNQNGTAGAFDELSPDFYVGDISDHPGEIPSGQHEVGIEITGKDDVRLYRGTLYVLLP